MKDVVPIIAKVEMDSRIGAACAKMAKDALLAHSHGFKGDLARIEIARRACAVALDARAIEEVKEKEARRRLLPGYVGGRPYTVHGSVFNTLSEMTGVPYRTMKRWLLQWNRVGESLGLERSQTEGVYVLDEPIEGVIGKMAPNPPSIEAWLENVLHPEAEDEQKPSPVEPKQIITKAGHTVQKLFAGRIPTKAELEALQESLNAALALSAKSSLPLYVAHGQRAKAMHKAGAKSPFRKE